MKNLKPTLKKVRTKGYNYNFNPETGFFARWGNKLADDPDWSPIGPEIADIEISTICHGVGAPCSFCYKANTSSGVNMTLETFKKVFKNLPSNLTQIAFGIGDIDSNPEMYDIFEYARDRGVIPNVTINGARMNEFHFDRLSKLCGAVAVSRYTPDSCYNTIKGLTDKGMTQVNIHQLLAKHTLKLCYQVIEDIQTDPRLERMNAIVFLAAKAKGRGGWLKPASAEEFKGLVDTCLEKGVRFGFDSCSANKFMKAIKGRKDLEMMAEPCESALFSIYINVKGEFFPCSFTEGEKGFEPLSVSECDNFLDDVWNNKKTIEWRKRLLDNCRSCPVFKV